MQAFIRLTVAALLVVPVAAAEKAARADKAGTAATREAIGPGKCLIRGTAIDTDAVPVPARSVRLRNLDTSSIEQVSVTDHSGVFSFIAASETPYIVEVTDEPGRVIAVGEVTIARAGEVAGGVVVIPAAIPAYSSAFKSSTGAILSALGGTGLTAVAPGTPPLSPEK
jgi:hypothetical protein